eukprot:3146152-Prymnesium_polylepis.1
MRACAALPPRCHRAATAAPPCDTARHRTARNLTLSGHTCHVCRARRSCHARACRAGSAA